MIDSSNLTNDIFGYSCYALTFPVSPELTQKVSALERASLMTRAKIPAHITVKGTFHRIDDLDEVRHTAREVITRVHRFWISFEAAEVEFTDRGTAWLSVPATIEMQHLHDRLVTEFKSLATTVYPDDPYQGHLTLFQEPQGHGLAAASELARRTDFGPGFEAFAVDLWGRQGPAHGGEWRLVEQYPLA